ncbi:MAG: pyruvate dehydrogenase (acetyl-transferring) E1 component subunit alpha [Bradymonadales bacterium]|nr:pyruvate dehydrogenase (acetyl-transferring) E1 component subunit alpha [Bradymonadales bacterium]
MPRKEIGPFFVTSLQILEPDGSWDETLEPDLSGDQLLRLYRSMLLGRQADQRMLKLQRQGRLGTFAPSTGHEAAHCGPVLAMTERDWFVGAYRELGARLMRGESLENALLLYNGFEEGNRSEAPNTTPVSIIVGAQYLHAVGIAYAMRYRGEKNAAAVVFGGDGSTSEGDFHEALNFAGVWKVPVVFVVQNNQWAISVPLRLQTASDTLAQKAIAYGIGGIQVDGNDALAMYQATREALDRAYSGEGATLIEAVTYRTTMHTTADDPTRYRSQEEVAQWEARDPLVRMRRYLETKGLLDDQQAQALDEAVQAEVERAVQAFEARTGFPPDVPFDHVFGTRHAEIEEQRALFLESVRWEQIAREHDEPGDLAPREVGHA